MRVKSGLTLNLGSLHQARLQVLQGQEKKSKTLAVQEKCLNSDII